MKNLFSYLMYAGTLPFILSAICLMLHIQELPLLGSTEVMLSAYGIVIASFLAGSHWGQHLHINKSHWSIALPILSNLIAVALWIGFLTLSFRMLVALLSIIFVILLMIDRQLLKGHFITDLYFKARFFVSSIALVSLMLSGLLS